MRKTISILILLSMVAIFALGIAAPGPTAILVIKDPWIDVRAYGATGDGTTDDTTAIQAASDAAGASKILLFPPGTFKTSSPLTITGNFHWRGSGIGRTIIKNEGTGNAITITGGVGSEITWGRMEKMTVQGQSGTNDGIACVLCGRIEFEEVLSKDHDGIGFTYTNSWSPSFIRCRAEGNGGDGVFLQGGANHNINGALFVGGAYSSNGGRGLYVESGSSDAMGVALYTVGFSSNTGVGVLIAQGGFYLNQVTIEFSDGDQFQAGTASLSAIQGALIQCTMIGDSGSPPARLAYLKKGSRIRIDGCRFKQATTAIRVDSGFTDVQIWNTPLAATVTNVIDWDDTLFTDGTIGYFINSDSLYVESAPVVQFFVDNASSGIRWDIINNPASGTGLLARIQNDGTTVWALTNDGVIKPQNTAVGIYSGSATPEGAITAAIGSIFLRTDGGANTSLYVKETGAGNTGWVAK